VRFHHLIGKTITNAVEKKLKGHDDRGFLELTFSDCTQVIIASSYGGYTGKSYDEYPTTIGCCYKKNFKQELEDLRK